MGAGIRDFDPKPHMGQKTVPSAVFYGAIGAAVLGLGILIAGVFVDPVAAKMAFQVNLNYFVAVTFGGLAFAAAMTITLARWSRPLKRVAEGLALATPIMVVLLGVFFLLGGLELYEWHTHPDTMGPHKSIWLQDGSFMARNLGALALVSVLGLVYIRASLKPDLILAKQNGEQVAGWVKTLGGGDDGDLKQAVAKSQKLQAALSPVLALVFALALTLYAFDVIMSLSPHWYSNMFGGWYFASAFWSGMVWIGILSLLFRGWAGMTKLLKPDVYHDLGKLVFAFSMVWAYMFMAQLLPIWYGNMTEEIGFILVRTQLEPWSKLAPVVGAMCFLIPFGTLLSRGIKKLPLGFGLVLGVIAVGVWLERYIVSVPSVWMEDSFPGWHWFIGGALGIGGLVVAVVAKYVGGAPQVPVSDPFMLPHPEDIHVHSRDDHHH